MSHPGIATVFDLIEAGDVSFIVYEFVEGRTLRRELTAGDSNAQDLVDAGVQLADALAAAHQKGVIHRDLKPENIMVVPADGCRRRMKILDFGLAKPCKQPLRLGGYESASTTLSTYTVPGLVVGTIAYMAPEEFEAAGFAMGNAEEHWAVLSTACFSRNWSDLNTPETVKSRDSAAYQFIEFAYGHPTRQRMPVLTPRAHISDDGNDTRFIVEMDSIRSGRYSPISPTFRTARRG